MAFWGVYVKPEEQYTLKPDCEGRRLRITQATLGEQYEVEMGRSVLQCAVGSNPPISICSLSMKELHCCSLNLEFEESEDVVFSVFGPWGVYLAGCYLDPCRTTCDGANGFIIKYYDGKTIEDAENVKDKKLSTTEEAESEKGKMFTTEEAENMEDKKFSTTEEAENKKDTTMTATEGVEKGKDEMLTAMEEDIGDTDSFIDGSLCGSEENCYDLSDSFIDDGGLSVQPSMQELLGAEVSGKMVENGKPKKGRTSSEGLKRIQSTESDGDNRSRQKRRTAKNSSSGVDDFKKGSGSIIMRGEKNKFNQLTVSGEPESGVDANSELKTHEYQDTKSQRKKKKQKTEKQKEDFSGGMVVENLAKGKPDGKIAARGRKVKIMYTAWVKETGKVIDSNQGQAPFKFQLGDEEIIEGWNVGIEGMRVGDKRRLHLPPSMGSWRTVESTVPPNSCLVYEIELVGVR